jgi:hypothetical protein
MPMSQGLTVMTDYTGAGTDKLKVLRLRDMIPNPDVAPAQQGIRGFLDEMSPMCAAQLRLELENLNVLVT